MAMRIGPKSTRPTKEVLEISIPSYPSLTSKRSRHSSAKRRRCISPAKCRPLKRESFAGPTISHSGNSTTKGGEPSRRGRILILADISGDIRWLNSQWAIGRLLVEDEWLHLFE